MNIKFVSAVCTVCLGANLVVTNCQIHPNVDQASDFGYVGSVVTTGVAGSSLATISSIATVDWSPIIGTKPIEYMEMEHRAVLLENRKELKNNV